MNRRHFLALLSAVPVLGRLVPKPNPVESPIGTSYWLKPSHNNQKPRVLMTFAERKARLPRGDSSASWAFWHAELDELLWSLERRPCGERDWTEETERYFQEIYADLKSQNAERLALLTKAMDHA